MKEKIENKINEVIEAIIAKDAKDVSYNEYRILENRYSFLRYEDEQKERNKKLINVITDTLSSASLPHPLPDES
jgi:ribonucleotide reductase alpha subunit